MGSSKEALPVDWILAKKGKIYVGRMGLCSPLWFSTWLLKTEVSKRIVDRILECQADKIV